MNKLFKKFSTVCITAIAAFCAFACSDKIAGTAEEPNQLANGDQPGSDVSSSSENLPTNAQENSSSSYEIHQPGTQSSSSNAKGNGPSYRNSSSSQTGTGVYNPVLSSSSSDQGNNEDKFPNFGHADTLASNTLDAYNEKYVITKATFDKNVLAYNKTFEGCDATNQTCFESPGIAEFRTIGLHKASTPKELNDLSFVFPDAANAMGGNLHEVDGCPLYVLNINETSPAVHILTKITKDTLTVATFYDNCDYERRPFDMYVGFLFSYCGELSEKPEIVMTSELNEAMTSCGTVDYKEYINKKLLSEKATLFKKLD